MNTIRHTALQIRSNTCPHASDDSPNKTRLPDKPASCGARFADTGKAQERAVEQRRPSNRVSGSDAFTYQEQLQQQHQQKQQAFEPRSDECSGDDGGVACCWLVVVRLLRILRSFSVAGDGPREETLLICNSDNKRKCMLFYSAISTPLDHSELFTRHLPIDLLMPEQTRLLWEAFIHAVITARILVTHVSAAVCSQVLIYTAPIC